jgi:hypothetical protein
MNWHCCRKGSGAYGSRTRCQMTKPSEPNRPSARARNSKRRDRCYDTCRDAIRFVLTRYLANCARNRDVSNLQDLFPMLRAVTTVLLFIYSLAQYRQRCYVTNSETRGGGQARGMRENGGRFFFHDSLHNKKKMTRSIRSNRSRGGGSYERARIKEKQRRPKGEKHEFDGFSLRYYTVESGDKITR